MRSCPVTIALAAVLLVCCGESAPGTESAAASPSGPVGASAAPAVAASPIAVPRVGDAGTGSAPGHAFTIEATPRLVRFDNATAVDALLRDASPAARTLVDESASEHGGDAKAGLWVHGEVSLLGHDRGPIDGLLDLAVHAVTRAKKQGERLTRPPQTTTSLALDRSLKMRTVFDILESTAMLEERSFLAVVEGPAGRRGVPFTWPERCPSPGSAQDCWSATAFVAADGVFVGLAHKTDPRCRGGPPVEQHLVAASDGGCPTMRRAEPGELDALLDALAPGTPRCREVLLGAEPGVTWAEVAPLISSLARRSEVMLTPEPTMHTRCEQAVPLKQLAAAIAADEPAPGLADDEVWGSDRLQPVPMPAPGSPPPKIVLDRVVASGGFSRGQVRKITEAHGGEIRHCYNAALARSPGVSGKIGYRLTIAADGKVGEVELDGVTFADADLQACVEASFRRWNYRIGETPTTSTTATVRWKLAPG